MNLQYLPIFPEHGICLAKVLCQMQSAASPNTSCFYLEEYDCHSQTQTTTYVTANEMERRYSSRWDISTIQPDTRECSSVAVCMKAGDE